jgi:hypothetical protein
MMTDRLPPVETDPLGAIRKELLSAAWQQKARADRRRRLVTVASSLMLTFVCLVGGAGALGVELPIITEALHEVGISRDEAEKLSTEPGGDPTLPKSPTDLKAGSDSFVDPISFPWGSGETATATAYLNTRDEVCFLLIRPEGRATGIGCTSPLLLADRVDAGVAYVVAVEAGPTELVLSGYVAPEIDRMTARGPTGSMQTRLGSTWTPDVDGASPLKPFVAVAPRSGDERFESGESDRALDVRNYTLEVHLPDGRTVTVQP